MNGLKPISTEHPAINEEILEAIAEIREMSVAIHGALAMIGSKKITDVQGLIMIAGYCRRLNAAVDILKRLGI